MNAITVARPAVVALAKEFNNILDLKIDVTKNATLEYMVTEMEKSIITLAPSDFEPAEEGETTFTETGIATYLALGFAIPIPAVAPTKTAEELMAEIKALKEQLATAKKNNTKKERTIQYTHQTAFVDALKAGAGTKEELVKRAHELYVVQHPDSPKESTSKHSIYFVAEVQFRYVMQCFVLYGIVQYDPATKIYSETVAAENDDTETEEVKEG